MNFKEFNDLADALYAIHQIRELHEPINVQGGVYCAAEHVPENTWDGWEFEWYTAPYPCQTIKLLEGLE